MQSTAVMLPLSGVLQNFPDHVLKNYCFLLAGTHAFLRASCGVSELGVIAPGGCPSSHCLTLIQKTLACQHSSTSRSPAQSCHLQRVLFSKLCTMHNHLLSFLSFHNHINTFSCSSFIRSKGK